MTESVINKLAQLISLSLIYNEQVSVSTTTFPRNQMLDVVIFKYSLVNGKEHSELYEPPLTIKLNSHDAITQIDNLLVKINRLYSSQANLVEAA
ncbi:hypothetical protein [Pseudoalteromonas sp. S16_S37]|uniref:hypothetical protein n=1 Tax=Pseudoalteromonas sp. S16_S37 TaxID=2720228 RepID=UPI0016800325|nr:hypothetical protein [Pseudoalteromonas sp. S16_S37]MBD1583463.1 hypothetical protein [Pseudoalteromonas sp. S16_S37]